jgi:hypothetical protein
MHKTTKDGDENLICHHIVKGSDGRDMDVYSEIWQNSHATILVPCQGKTSKHCRIVKTKAVVKYEYVKRCYENYHMSTTCNS